MKNRNILKNKNFTNINEFLLLFEKFRKNTLSEFIRNILNKSLIKLETHPST